MRRLAALTVALVLVPAGTALGADLDELLDESRQASYTAEQVITCSTPDGPRDAVVKLTQAAGEISVGAPVDPEVQVSSGGGGWTLVREGSVVSSATVEGSEVVVEQRYTVDEGSATEFLGREATLYRMTGEGVVRAELVFDAEVGALLRVVTFTEDGSVYCVRRFIAFDPLASSSDEGNAVSDEDLAESGAESDLPQSLVGFDRLDVYEDDEGFVFAYYSDGFFSFAVFQTPSLVALDDGISVSLAGGTYERSFSPGQVTYAWETRAGGMAMVGDLPPDMHQAVLDGLPGPEDPGLFRRLWRSLFGWSR